jgi:hypothetical protein
MIKLKDVVEGSNLRKMFKFSFHDFETRPRFNEVLLLWFNAYFHD